MQLPQVRFWEGEQHERMKWKIESNLKNRNETQQVSDQGFRKQVTWVEHVKSHGLPEFA